MAKMCMVRLITGASCLPGVLSSELPLFCSEPDRCNALPTGILDAVQSMPQNSECPRLEDAEVSLSPF